MTDGRVPELPADCSRAASPPPKAHPASSGPATMAARITSSASTPAVKAAAQLRAEGKNVRVVSMPCVELFEEQDAAYRESVLPAACRKRLVVEASSSFGWHKYTGFEGDSVSIDRFGASAPAATVAITATASPTTIAVLRICVPPTKERPVIQRRPQAEFRPEGRDSKQRGARSESTPSGVSSVTEGLPGCGPTRPSRCRLSRAERRPEAWASRPRGVWEPPSGAIGP